MSSVRLRRSLERRRGEVVHRRNGSMVVPHFFWPPTHIRAKMDALLR